MSSIMIAGMMAGCASPRQLEDISQPPADVAKPVETNISQPENVERENGKADDFELTELTMERLQKRMDASDDFIVYAAVASCPHTPSFLNVLTPYVRKHNLKDKVLLLLVATEDELEMLKQVTPRRWYRSDGQGWAPTMLIAVKDGKPLDWHSADSTWENVEEQIQNFFGRNGYTHEARVYAEDFRSTTISNDKMRRRIQVDASAMNFDGRSLDGWELVKRSFGGSSLQGTSLKGANLEGSSFAYANLKGADLEGANLEDVTWYDTICPDGTNSDDNGGTCVGHLEVAAR